MLFISILYTSRCCVFITNLTPLRTLRGGKDTKRQLGKRGGEDRTSGIISEKRLQKQREELDCQKQPFQEWKSTKQQIKKCSLKENYRNLH